MFAAKIERAKAWLEQLTEEASAYVLSIVLFLIVLFYNLIRDIDGTTVLFVIPFLLLLYGFYVYIVQVYKPMWGSIVGKILISGLVFVSSSFSLALSKLAVNASLQVPSSPFLSTISIITVLVSPLAVTLIFGFLGIIILPIAMPLFLNDEGTYSVKRIILFWRPKPVGSHQICKFMIWFGLLMLLIIFAWAFNGNNTWYTKKVETFAKWYAYNFDTEAYSHCKLESGQRIAYIDSSNIIIASEKEKVIEFKVSKCIVSQ
jgi:hypothetical protein